MALFLNQLVFGNGWKVFGMFSRLGRILTRSLKAEHVVPESRFRKAFYRECSVLIFLCNNRGNRVIILNVRIAECKNNVV